MEPNGFITEPGASPATGAALTANDIETLARLMAELRELTQSRGSFAAASEFLKRFGYDSDASALVRPERLAN